MPDNPAALTSTLYEKFLKAVIYDDLFLYFAQVGDYRSSSFKEAYEQGAMAFARKKPELIEKLSNEFAQILTAMSRIDILQGYVKGYLELEEKLRRESRSVFTYSIDPIRQSLVLNARSFEASAKNPVTPEAQEILDHKDRPVKIALADFL